MEVVKRLNETQYYIWFMPIPILFVVFLYYFIRWRQVWPDTDIAIVRYRSTVIYGHDHHTTMVHAMNLHKYSIVWHWGLNII